MIGQTLALGPVFRSLKEEGLIIKIKHKMAKTTFKSRHIGVSVNCPAKKAYKFASNPENLPKWASGLSSSIKKADGELIAESPMGKIKIKFANKNKFGILDHDVTLPSGERVYNPMRVFTNNRGSEFVFTIYQKTGMSGKMFEDDAKLVKKDLEKLKELLEKSQT